MSSSATMSQPVSFGRRLKRFMADRPLIPLIILLVILVVILQALRPGIVNERWIANTAKFA
ncbi:MAG: ABC transporter permease, partial [Mesorhizobium sp.]